MKKLLAFILLLVFCLPLLAQDTEIIVPEDFRGYRRGMSNFYSWLANPRVRNLQLGTSVLDSLGRVLLYVQNKSGSSLSAGDVCIWDNTAVSVADSDDVVATLVVENDLTDEGGYLTLVMDVTGTADAGDSVEVWGTTWEAGTTDYTKMLIPASAGVTFVVTDTATGNPILHWSDVDSIKFNADAVANGASDVDVDAYPVAGVTSGTGARGNFAGVAISSMADDAFGYIIIRGVASATVDAGTNDAAPGAVLDVTTNGDFVSTGNTTTGQAVARAMEYSTIDNKAIRVYIDGGGPNQFTGGDFGDGNIANVGEIAVDKVDADGAALALGDNDETVEVNSSDWDISTAGAATGMASFTFDGGELFDDGTAGALASGGSLTEYLGVLNKTTITFAYGTDSVDVTDNGSNGSCSYKIYDFPEGAIMVLGATVDRADSTTIDAAATVYMSLGTTAANADGDLGDAGEANIVPSVEYTFSSGAVTNEDQTTSTEANAIVDGTSSAVDLYINAADADDPGASKLIFFSGTVTFTWVNLGDY